MKKFMFVLLCLMMTGAGSAAFSQQADDYRIPPTGVYLTRFVFVASDTGIDLVREDNAAEMGKLLGYIDDNLLAIRSGSAPILVEGYYAGSGSEAARIAGIMKGEICSRRDIPEVGIRTDAHSKTFVGSSRVVLVSVPIRVPDPETPPAPELRSAPASEEVVQPVPASQPAPVVRDSWQAPRTNLVLRTNLLHWAGGMLNAGVEIRTSGFGFKLDGGWSHWKWKGEERVWKNWYVNPEARWYMGAERRFYLGVGGSYADFNICLSDTGYQGKLYGGGLTVGYQARLSRRLSMDFNLGLGYQRIEYDSFTVVKASGSYPDDIRRYKDRDKTENWYGPVQAGVSLSWKLGRVK